MILLISLKANEIEKLLANEQLETITSFTQIAARDDVDIVVFDARGQETPGLIVRICKMRMPHAKLIMVGNQMHYQAVFMETVADEFVLYDNLERLLPETIRNIRKT